MLPMNAVQQSEEAPVIQQRILQLHSKPIEFDLRSQYIKHNLVDELRKYDAQHGLPDMQPSSESTGSYEPENNVHNKGVQESYRGFRKSWDPRRQNAQSMNYSNFQNFPMHTSHVEIYDQMYGTPAAPDHHQPMDATMSNGTSYTESPYQHSSAIGGNVSAENYLSSTGYQHLAQVSPQFQSNQTWHQMMVNPTLFNPQLALLWVYQHPDFFEKALANFRAYHFQSTQYQNPPHQHEATQMGPVEIASENVSLRNDTTLCEIDGNVRANSFRSEIGSSMEAMTGDRQVIPENEQFPSESEYLASSQSSLSSYLDIDSISNEENSSCDSEFQSPTKTTSTPNLDNEVQLNEHDLDVLDECHSGTLEMAETSEVVMKNISKRSLKRSARRERQRERKSCENQSFSETTNDELSSPSTKKHGRPSKSFKKQGRSVKTYRNDSSTVPVPEKVPEQNERASKNANTLESSSSTESVKIFVKSNNKLSKLSRKALKKKERAEKRMTNEKPRQKSGSSGTRSNEPEDGKNEEGESRLNNSPESRRIQPAPQPEELFREPVADEQQFLVEQAVPENIPDGIVQNARVEQQRHIRTTRLNKVGKWMSSASESFRNEPIDPFAAVSMLTYSDAMIGFRIPHAIWHSKHAKNDHFKFDTTGLLEEIMAHTTKNPLSFTSDPSCIERCEKFLEARVKVYENWNDKDEQTLYIFFKTILDFEQKHFFIQDLMYLSSLVADDKKSRAIDERYSIMFGNVMNFHMIHLQERYFPSHPGFGDLSILIVNQMGPGLLTYLDKQYKLRVRYVPGEEEQQRIEKTLTLRQKMMLELYRKSDLSKGKWSVKDSEKFLILLLISALNLPKSDQSQLIIRLYRFLLLIQSTVLDIDLFMYSKVLRISPFDCSIAKHKFILNPWFNI